MIRVLLAVTLAAALLAASLPAVESAAADRTDAALNRDIDRLQTIGESLLASEDIGARRTLTVSLSAERLTTAGVSSFTIACRPVCAVRYELTGRPVQTRTLSLPLATPDGPIRLSGPGEHRLSLGLAINDGQRVVVLRG